MIGRVGLLLFAMMASCAALCLATQDVEDPAVVVFYREGCEDCLRMEPVLKELEALHPDLGFRYIEGADRDAPLMWSLATAYGVIPAQFPVIFVGKTAIVGASRANELQLRAAVEVCARSSCPSPLDRLQSSRIPWLTILLVGLAVVVLAVAFLA